MLPCIIVFTVAIYVLSDLIQPAPTPWTLTYVTVDSSLTATTAYEIDIDTGESRFLFDIPPEDQLGDIYDITPNDDGNVRYLTEVRTISPDRNFYVQTFWDDDDLWTVLVNVATNERYRLANFENIAWSTNSDYIAYDFWEGDYFRVYIQAISADRSPEEPIPLSIEGVTARSPMWSPDGQYIAFRQLFEDARRQDVYVTQIDTRETMSLTNNLDSQYPVFWTYDSQQIAYFGCDGICLSDLSGQVVQTIPMPEVGFYEDVEAWSVHNDVIAVISNDNASFRPVQLTLISLDTKLRLHFILEPLQALAPRYWSPDIRRYAFIGAERRFYATDNNLQVPRYITDEIFRIIK